MKIIQDNSKFRKGCTIRKVQSVGGRQRVFFKASDFELVCCLKKKALRGSPVFVMSRFIALLSISGLASAIDCNVQTNRLIFSRFGQFFDSYSRNGQVINSQLDINSNCWLQWSGWSECTGVCGNAVKTARRKCRGGIPGVVGSGCEGSEIKRRRCEPNEMVQGKGETYCPYWSFWSEWGACNVEPSLDPCIRNMQGFSQRFRECNDPYATSQGEIPNCEGEPSEARACTSNQIIAAQIPNDQRYLMSEWSECSVQ